ncbi:CotD family spore coat protein [Mycolicibacter heraklionensis]|uniref:CotD family spore coat protein n=1 Tax=Mycolicibacter heraklionensis TaxID=512402 RepID=UPI0009EDA1E2
MAYQAPPRCVTSTVRTGSVPDLHPTRAERMPIRAVRRRQHHPATTSGRDQITNSRHVGKRSLF